MPSSRRRRNGYLEIQVGLDSKRLRRSQKSVIIFIERKLQEIFKDPVTGSTDVYESNDSSPPLRFEFRLTSFQPRDIRNHLRTHLGDNRWLSGNLAPKISRAATDICSSGFVIRVVVTITHKKFMNTTPLTEEEARQQMLRNLVQGGKIEGGDLNEINREGESCPICLEDFITGSHFTFPTRMSCSHIFHEVCLLDWLQREKTCPLCRVELYE